jgi:hypothetical protein
MNGVEKAKRLVLYARSVGTKATAVQRGSSWRGANGWLALMAVGALALGSLVYVLDRPAATVYLLPNVLSLARGHHRWFGALGGNLPEFVHVYAFILLTVAVGPWPARVLPICAFWWAVDSLFKVGEHPLLAPHIAAVLPAWFQHVPILDNTGNYFLHGTFDPWDLVAILVGSIVAYLTIGLVRRREVDHVTDTPVHS